jgi:hypothetical protein
MTIRGLRDEVPTFVDVCAREVMRESLNLLR